jgi:hypothetical protein
MGEAVLQRTPVSPQSAELCTRSAPELRT